jgi:hypothetical protein
MLESFQIATFNLLNLNEPGLPVYTDQDGWSQAEYDRKIEWTAHVIRQLRPEVMGFQELWHRKSLETALVQSGLSNDYDLIVPANATGTGIVCAAIVRKGLLVGTPEWIVNFPDRFVLKSSGDDPQTPAISVNVKKFSRPVLHFEFKPRADEDPLHVYVCHSRQTSNSIPNIPMA